MQVPQTPQSIDQLDLMKRLDTYANGKATWSTDGNSVSPSLRQACKTLHAHLIQLVNEVLAPLLDRTTSREMETFTMHDRRHGLKVAHLMWHILIPARRDCLTPPEIAMLVLAAYMHDLGMVLSPGERNARLEPTSDLSEKLELEESLKCAFEQLRAKIADPRTPELAKRRAERELYQAEEALLSRDTRDRHATRERYEQLLSMLDDFHQKDPIRIPEVASCLSFEGNSFRQKLVDICVSHNEETEALVRRDETDFARPRFPADYPVGSCSADLHLIAAALRLGDILDFDRERTPPVLFHYLLPASVGPQDSRSVLEWGKHLTISNWHIDPDAVVFRGRCHSHIIHHAVVNFCRVIQEEIASTLATFKPLGESGDWPFVLPATVKPDIHSEGYRYVPYRFELDDESVYALLMGGAIYDNPLVAVRELVQNAVDACKLRDAITRLHEPHVQPSPIGRIIVRYVEPTHECPLPRLIVEDKGAGMDAWIIKKWYLPVGRSYYCSAEFNSTRVALRRENLDFAPVAEFGIGFLSCFLLADRVLVETAMWESPRGDTRKRTLEIEGPTRLIRLDEQVNDGPGRFRGTKVTLYLCRGGGAEVHPPVWANIRLYLQDVCQDLPYRLHLEHVSNGRTTQDSIDSKPLRVELPNHLENLATKIKVDDKQAGLEGEIAIVNAPAAQEAERDVSREVSAEIIGEGSTHNALLRGGFKIGPVPGLPDSYLTRITATAKLRLTWNGRPNHRFVPPNLARTGASDEAFLAHQVLRIWLTYLLEHANELPLTQLHALDLRQRDLTKCNWMETYDAYTVYRLARLGWQAFFGFSRKDEEKLLAWEAGKGNPLRLGIFQSNLYWKLLDLVLPRVSSIQMGPEARFYVIPPVSNWRSILQGCRDYITSPVSWGMFVEYVNGLEDLLLYEYPGSVQFNSRFRDVLASFHDDELRQLFRVLRKLAETRGEQQAELTRTQAAMFHRAVGLIGHLSIGSIHGKWRIDRFSIPSHT